MKIAVLAPIAWRTPPRAYGPWEQVAGHVAEGMVARGHEVHLYATGDSQTTAHLHSTIPRGYEEFPGVDVKVEECLHISQLMEEADNYDIIHNHFDFLPLSYSRLIHTPMVTTIHGFGSLTILPVYKKYNATSHYVSISLSDRNPQLTYAGNVYNGIDPGQFDFGQAMGNYLLFMGRFHPDKGAADAIKVARASGIPLIMAGLIQDEQYWQQQVLPHIDDKLISYRGNVGPAERRELLSGAMALLHPIYFDEPFGLSVAESMMSGTPVIAYNRGSMPELIQNGQTGYLVNTPEEMVKAIAALPLIDRSYCHTYALNSFSRDTMCAEYEDVYRSILASGK